MDIKEISYKRSVQFEGRNGVFKQAGIRLFSLPADSYGDQPAKVFLRPVTTKDTIGRCCVEIPLAELPRVVDALRSYLPVPTYAFSGDELDMIYRALMEASEKLLDIDDERNYTPEDLKAIREEAEDLQTLASKLEIPAIKDHRFPAEDWRYEVANGDTSLGYKEWLEHKREAANTL